MRVEGRCWTRLGLDGKWVTALAQTEWGLYAGTHADGVFRLDAGTGRWESLRLDHAIVSSILFVPGAPGAPARLLVGVEPFADEQTAAAVFASEDRGATWRPSDGGLAERHDRRAWAYSLAADPTQPQRVYMGTNYPILRSNDGGRAWEFVWLTDTDLGGGQFNAILVSPRGDGRVWAGGQTGFFSAVLLRSNDGGNTWALSYPLPQSDNEVNSLATDASGIARGELWAGVGGGVFQSDDAGASWRHVLSPRSPSSIRGLAWVGGDLYALASILPPAPDQPSVITNLGLYRSRDRGASWNALGAPPRLGGGEALVTDSEGRLIIGTRGSGVWRVAP